ncbi:MAG: hypothetical protein ABSB01_03470 [Streptosporangiaceae bacterium]|jgi:hypothetical protein
MISRHSLSLDSPHWGLSVDFGSGKSVLIRCIVPQILPSVAIAA